MGIEIKDPEKVITRPCPVCNETQTVTVDPEAYASWKVGKKLIQHAFPELTSGQREILQTGICSRCWDTMWGED